MKRLKDVLPNVDRQRVAVVGVIKDNVNIYKGLTLFKHEDVEEVRLHLANVFCSSVVYHKRGCYDEYKLATIKGEVLFSGSLDDFKALLEIEEG